MDKSWIALAATPNGRLSERYMNGVKAFVQFAIAVADQEGRIRCPCKKCVNVLRQMGEAVRAHLIVVGIMQTYVQWVEHGEPRISASNGDVQRCEYQMGGNEKNEGLNALGLKHLATSVIGSAQPKYRNKKGNKLRDTKYDNDYRLSDGEDDAGDGSSDSLVHEVSEMAPQKRFTDSDPLSLLPIQHRDSPAEGGSLHVDEMGSLHVDMLETRPDGGSLHADEMNATPSESNCSSVGSTGRSGQTRVVRTERLVKKEGKLPVSIYAKYRKPMGRHANSFSSAAGIKHQSAVAITNRASLDTDHSCGSKSMAVRGNELILANADQPFEMVVFYHTNHYNDKKKKRAAPVCGSKHEALKKRLEDRCSQSNATPLTAEELSIQVLGARSGCLKGLGMRPSSFKTTATSFQVSKHIRRLEKRVLQREAANQSQSQSQSQSQIQAQAQAQAERMAKHRQMAQQIEKQTQQMASMFAWMRRQGYNGEGDSSGAGGAS